jgi:hypothetical protein
MNSFARRANLPQPCSKRARHAVLRVKKDIGTVTFNASSQKQCEAESESIKGKLEHQWLK